MPATETRQMWFRPNKIIRLGKGESAQMIGPTGETGPVRAEDALNKPVMLLPRFIEQTKRPTGQDVRKPAWFRDEHIDMDEFLERERKRLDRRKGKEAK